MWSASSSSAFAMAGSVNIMAGPRKGRGGSRGGPKFVEMRGLVLRPDLAVHAIAHAFGNGFQAVAEVNLFGVKGPELRSPWRALSAIVEAAQRIPTFLLFAYEALRQR